MQARQLGLHANTQMRIKRAEGLVE